MDAGQVLGRGIPAGPVAGRRRGLHPGREDHHPGQREVVQEDSTSDLVFSPAALVAYLSVLNELRPGDVILTGTPAGVALGRRNASGRHPWLKPGDVLETEIESLGTSRNTFI